MYVLPIMYFINVLAILVKSKKIKQILIYLILVMIISISGFRLYDADYSYYRNIYENPKAHLEIPILFKLLGEVIKKMAISYRNYLLILNLIITGWIYRIYKAISVRYDVSLLIYLSYLFYIFQMTQYRNLLGVLVFFTGMLFVSNKVFKAIFMISAILIHPSTVVLLAVYLYKVSSLLKVKNIVYVYILSLGISYFNIIYFIIKILIKINIPNISEKLLIYMNQVKPIGITLYEIVYNIIFILVTLNLEDFKCSKNKLITYTSFYLGIISLNLLSFSDVLYQRISQNFLFLFPVAVGIYFEKRNNYHRLVIILILFIFNLIIIFYSARETFLPYLEKNIII